MTDCKNTTSFSRITEVDSIVSTLVKNIYEHEEYQSYLDELSLDPEKEKKVKKINDTFADLRVFNTNTNPYFLASDIGLLLGLSNITSTIKTFNIEEKLEGEVDIDGSIKKKMFLTRHGVYRIIFNSKTKLSELFRSFVYKLLDHMMLSENIKLRTKFLEDVREEKSELIKEAISELNENYLEYKNLYEIEQRRRQLVENELEVKDKDFSELAIEQMYSNNYLKQLLENKKHLLSKRTLEDEHENNVNSLKKRYMREVKFYIISPSVLAQIVKKIPKEEMEGEEKYITSYNRNFKFNILCLKDTNINTIDETEIVYLYFEFKATSKEGEIHVDDKLIYVGSDRVHSKEYYAKFIEEMKGECEYYPYPGSKNKIVFKGTIDHAKNIIQNLIE